MMGVAIAYLAGLVVGRMRLSFSSGTRGYYAGVTTKIYSRISSQSVGKQAQRKLESVLYDIHKKLGKKARRAEKKQVNPGDTTPLLPLAGSSTSEGGGQRPLCWNRISCIVLGGVFRGDSVESFRIKRPLYLLRYQR